MKFRLATALALTLAFTSMATPIATAEQQAAQFRTVAPQAFSTAELQAYGLSANDAAQVAELQRQGYQVRVLSAEEAAQYSGGMSNRTWWIIGAVVVIAVVVAASN
ncbi:MAG: hypothetical protein ABL883_05465 [Terricaulis sp.]